MLAVVTAFIASIAGVLLDSRYSLVSFAWFLKNLALLVIASAIHFLVGLWWLLRGPPGKVVRQRRPFALGDGHADDGHTDDGNTTEPEDDDDDDADSEPDHDDGDDHDDHGIGSGRIAVSHRSWGGIVGREPILHSPSWHYFGWSDDDSSDHDVSDTAGGTGSID